MSTVTIGCKLPNGILMELGDKQVVINGANSSEIIGGHGLTENVDKSFFDAWMERNKELKFVKIGHIFAHEKTASTKAQAKERAKEKTGLEPLDPNKKPAGITDVKDE